MSGASSNKEWLHPNEVLKLQRFKSKRKQLQARIHKSNSSPSTPQRNPSKEIDENSHPESLQESQKRRNPFLIDRQDSKRLKLETADYGEESSDQALFKFFNGSESGPKTTSCVSLGDLYREPDDGDTERTTSTCIKEGETWFPIDWGLKSKIRLISSKPFAWSQKLKIGEETSGITGFVRCLDVDSETSLDISPNARFHQCCLYWQQPYLPWLNVFPRDANRISSAADFKFSVAARESLQNAWTDSFRSLFQLLRTCQCPYFYVCTDVFTVLIRAAGICGGSEMKALVTPTTRGFRQMLRQEDIEFSMPLKHDDGLSVSTTHDEEGADEQWLESMGFGAEDIKRINYAQTKTTQRAECETDNSEQSLILIEGTEVQAFYNFLINYKNGTSTTGPLAGVPPTLLAPVAFNGATLGSLKVKESRARLQDVNYYSLELSGPILPHVIHNLCAVRVDDNDQDMTATFANFAPTASYSKVKQQIEACHHADDRNTSRASIFGRENLSDCGLSSKLLKHFCSSSPDHIDNVNCLKYNGKSKTYTWS